MPQCVALTPKNIQCKLIAKNDILCSTHLKVKNTDKLVRTVNDIPNQNANQIEVVQKRTIRRKIIKHDVNPVTNPANTEDDSDIILETRCR